MIIVDTSAWVEYFMGGIPLVVDKVDQCLEQDFAGMATWCIAR